MAQNRKQALFLVPGIALGSTYPTLTLSCASVTRPESLSEIAASTAPRDPYGLTSLTEKRVDNRGQGHEPLYGTRNFRAVLAGRLYRGGANNRYHRDSPRDNRNPLASSALKNLCEEGFESAVYLYSTNFSSAPTKVDCVRRGDAKPNTLIYQSLSPYRESHVREMLVATQTRLRQPSAGPAYFHCWNGWHASGLISAYALRQFCGMSGAQAVRYWDLNTDGNHRDPAFEKLRKQIRDFVPYSDLVLAPREKEAFCLPLTRTTAQ
jgi:hypothetical protein